MRRHLQDARTSGNRRGGPAESPKLVCGLAPTVRSLKPNRRSAGTVNRRTRSLVAAGAIVRRLAAARSSSRRRSPIGPTPLSPGDLLGPFDGIVVDAETDRPVAGALVAGSWAFERGIGLIGPAGRQRGGPRDRRRRPLPASRRSTAARRGVHAGAPVHPDRLSPGLRRLAQRPPVSRGQRPPRLQPARQPGAAGEVAGRAAAPPAPGVPGRRRRHPRSAAQGEVQAGGDGAGGAAPRAARLVPPRRRPRAARKPLLDATPLLSEDELRGVTGYAGEFDIGKLTDLPTTEFYDSRHFKARGQPESCDVALRVWRLGRRAPRPSTASCWASCPARRVTDELGDTSLRARAGRGAGRGLPVARAGGGGVRELRRPAVPRAGDGGPAGQAGREPPGRPDAVPAVEGLEESGVKSLTPATPAAPAAARRRPLRPRRLLAPPGPLLRAAPLLRPHPGEPPTMKRALPSRTAVPVALAVLALAAAGPARAWDPATTQAGLTERALLASSFHKVLAQRLGRPLGAFEPLALHSRLLSPAERQTLWIAADVAGSRGRLPARRRGRGHRARLGDRRRGAGRDAARARAQPLLRSAHRPGPGGQDAAWPAPRTP